MANFIPIPFATSGNRVAVPETTQSNGNVSWQEGFGPDYQLNPGVDPDAKVIPRDSFNQILYELSIAIQQYQSFGVPEFITSADNLGSPFSYSQFARVRYDAGSGFKVYESLVSSNTELPTNTTNWAEVPAPNNTGIPAGAMFDYGGVVAPDGFLLCYGQAVSRSVYASLYANIGTNFGVGDGSSTFNLPDFRGRVAVGRDNMGAGGDGTGTAAGRITNGVAGFVGTQMGASGGNQSMPAHTHGVTDNGHTHGLRLGATGGNLASSIYTNIPSNNNVTGQTESSQTGIAINSAGAGNSGNVQPSLIATKIIKI